MLIETFRFYIMSLTLTIKIFNSSYLIQEQQFLYRGLERTERHAGR